MNGLLTTVEETELRKGNSKNLYRALNTVTKRTTTEIKLTGT